MVYLILLYFLGCNLRRLIFAEIIFARLTFAWIYFREFEFYHNSCVFIFGYVEIAIILRERISVVTRYLMFMPSMMITGENKFLQDCQDVSTVGLSPFKNKILYFNDSTSNMMIFHLKGTPMQIWKSPISLCSYKKNTWNFRIFNPKICQVIFRWSL